MSLQAATTSSATTSSANGVGDDEEFLDPVTWEVIVDPVVGSDGKTYDRCHTALLRIV